MVAKPNLRYKIVLKYVKKQWAMRSPTLILLVGLCATVVARECPSKKLPARGICPSLIICFFFADFGKSPRPTGFLVQFLAVFVPKTTFVAPDRKRRFVADFR